MYGGGVGQVFYEAQAADLSITSNAVFQNTDLVIPLASGTYGFEMVCFATSNASPGLTLELDYTGTVTLSSVSKIRNRAGSTTSLVIAGTLPLSFAETTTDSQWNISSAAWSFPRPAICA